MQSYVDAGMEITSYEDVEKVLKTIGFYRLRGYSFHLYDNTTKKYVAGTKFKDIIKLYQFDQELSWSTIITCNTNPSSKINFLMFYTFYFFEIITNVLAHHLPLLSLYTCSLLY